MAKLIYLASIYSVGVEGTGYAKGTYGTATPEVKHQRYVDVCKKTAQLLKEGHKVFSPIAHSHAVEVEGMGGEVQSGNFWLDFDFAVLAKCDELWVYQMPGWERSVGIAKEIEFANNNKIPIKYLEYDETGSAGTAKAA